MAQQYPSKKRLLEIAAAADKWAKKVRENWALSGASSKENPARFKAMHLDPADEDDQRELCRQTFDTIGENENFAKLLSSVDPANPFEGSPEEDLAEQCGSHAKQVTDKTISGWPPEVGSAIKLLRKVCAALRKCYDVGKRNGSNAKHKTKLDALPVRDMDAVEWATDVLRRAENPPGRSDEAQSEAPADGTAKGVAARNAIFLKWYESKDSRTYRSHAKIRDKWNELTREQRVAICPAADNKVSREVVIQSVNRAKKKRNEARPKARKKIVVKKTKRT